MARTSANAKADKRGKTKPNDTEQPCCDWKKRGGTIRGPRTFSGVSLAKGKLEISFRNRQDLLERLLRLAQVMASPQIQPALRRAKSIGRATRRAPDQAAAKVEVEIETLGFERAETIVVACAFGETDLNRTIGDLGLDNGLFHACVLSGVEAEGFEIGPEEVPNSDETTLFEVVVAVAGARKRNGEGE